MNGANTTTFVRYCGFGAVGFVVDAGVLTILVSGFGWDHYVGRLLSFALAVTTTWYLNRNFAFRPTPAPGREYARYFSIQILGAVINLGTYVAVIQILPQMASVPAIPLAIGAAPALAFNFLASHRFVFHDGKTAH